MDSFGRIDEFSIDLAQKITGHVPVVWMMILIIKHKIRSHVQI
jgi:hypothetical protein